MLEQIQEILGGRNRYNPNHNNCLERRYTGGRADEFLQFPRFSQRHNSDQSTDVNEPNDATKKKEHVTIYTDGAAEPNPGPGGYGVVLMSGSYRRELSGGFRKTTNNRMELMAAIVALESLKRPCRVILYSDSKYVVDSVSRGSVLRWKKKNWFRAPKERVKNVDLWKRFLVVYEKHEVQFRWVKGHAGIKENERCDELAVAATQQYDLPIDEGYLEELMLRDTPPDSTPTHHVLKSSSQSTKKKEDTGQSPRVDALLEEGAPCRKCDTPLIKKPTKKTKPKPGQTYCYDWYLFCPGCCTMYMVDAAKRIL